MNATRWHTLTDFVAHLGRTGKCRVDETEEGWFLMLVAADKAKAAAEAARAKREKAERDDAARAAAAVAAQAERAAKEAAGKEGDGNAAVSHELVRCEGEAPVRVAVAAAARGARAPAPPPAFGDDGEGDNDAAAAAAAKRARPLSKLEEVMARETAAKKAREDAAAEAAPPAPAADDAPWIAPGLVVKLVAKELKGAGLYKAKAEIKSVAGHVATVATLDTGAVLKVDQAHLETVLPGVGGRVAIVAGPGGRARRASLGHRGALAAIDEAAFQARVVLDAGGDDWFEYDHICKVVGSGRR
jgi:DNA/RNA-binding protein KIN17